MLLENKNAVIYRGEGKVVGADAPSAIDVRIRDATLKKLMSLVAKGLRIGGLGEYRR